MKLFERLRHSEKSALASAIVAIPANREIDKCAVATAIPAISAIRKRKTKANHFQNSQIAKIALAKPKNENSVSVLAALAKFQIDACASDPEPEILTRTNNMAWEFMQVDGMAFENAINLAAEIVVYGQVAVCEAAYVDVQKLWRRVTGKSR